MVASLSSSSDEPTMDNPELQNILKCIIPRTFTRSVVSIGLQHADDPVKHGTLRIVLESLKSLAGLMLEIDSMAEKMTSKQGDTSRESIVYLHGLPSVNCFVELDKCLATGGISCPATDALGTWKWVSLKQLIQDEVRAMLPEPQVLLKLLSSSGQKQKYSGTGLKRHAHLPEVASKKSKLNDTSEDIDIIISGIDSEHDNGIPENGDQLKAENTIQDLDVMKDDRTVIAEIWGLSEQTLISDELNHEENFFQSKLLDAFKFYLVSFLFMQSVFIKIWFETSSAIVNY